MKDNIEVRCCNCGWQGTEYELELIGIVEKDGEEIVVSHESRDSGYITVLKFEDAEEFIDGCPKCLTDHYLTNIE